MFKLFQEHFECLIVRVCLTTPQCYCNNNVQTAIGTFTNHEHDEIYDE